MELSEATGIPIEIIQAIEIGAFLPSKTGALSTITEQTAIQE
jgi:hypothetical protein